MNMIERPCNDREFYDYYNDSGANLLQNHFVLKVNVGGVAAPVLGYIPDQNGILAGAYGKICSQVGSVFQLDQIAAEVAAQLRDTALYMTPGSGNFHITPVAGDYKVAFLTEDQGAHDYVTAQLTPPERVHDDEIPT